MRRFLFFSLVAGAIPWAGPMAAGQSGPPRLPPGAPTLTEDKVVMVVGSSVSVRRYKVRPLPAWTGGHNRVPPQCTNGQNVFFRVFEMLNDHENMRWRRLPDRDWARSKGKAPMDVRVRGGTKTVQVADWAAFRDLPWRDASPRIMFLGKRPGVWAEIKVPAGTEKLELIYASDPNGGTIQVTLDGKPPPENARVDTFQDPAVPPRAKLGASYDTLDSHGKPVRIRPPKQGIRNIVELRARYGLDPKIPHTFRIERATKDPGKRILVWGVVYWRKNCVQVVQRAKGGINCGALPAYAAIQETIALQPDYLLMEAINIRGAPAGVTRSLDPGYAWCARHKDTFKVMVYSTCQASSKAFRAWFRDPKHKPPYGAKDYQKTCADAHGEACQRAVVDLCRKYGFPLVDVGKAADAYVAKHPGVRFVPHILNDWYHPNQWGAALFGRTIRDGIKKHWPELPLRPIRMPPPPAPAELPTR